MRKDITLEEFTKIVASINSRQDLHSMVNAIIEITKNAIHCDGCSILLYNQENDCLEFQFSIGEKSESLLSLKVPRGKGIAGFVMDTLETVIVNDAQSDPRLYKEIDSQIDFVTRNLICVPMLAHGKFIGVLEAVNTLGRESFDELDAKDLKNISEVAAIAINNRYLIDELNNRIHEINGLLRVSQTLSSVQDEDSFLEIAGKLVQEFLDVQRLSYISKSKNSSKWRIRYSIGLPPVDQQFLDIEKMNNVTTRVIRSGEPMLVENINKENFPFPFSANYKSNSFISMPVKLKDKVIGVLNVTDKNNKRVFNKTDLKLLEIIVHNVMESYQALLSRRERDSYKQLRRDLDMASKFQQYSLPQIPSQLGELEIATYYQPSTEIGGDFYDLIYHWDGQYTFVIGDVAGKGISAALFMELSKTILNTEISRYVMPGVALLHSHRIFQEKFEPFMHVEVMVVQIDTERKQIKYASAGHNRQIFFKQQTDEILLLRGKGLPLGSRIKINEFPEKIINYNEGDLLLLYTDGVTETLNKEKTEMFGEERVFEILKEHKNKSPKEIIDLIVQKTHKFRSGKEISDDYTMLLIRLA
jgi:serine phosphatase RsbU (regulator of sigma subunit)